MINEEIIGYVQERESVTVALLQKQFSLPYNKAKAIIDEMVEDERLVYDSGVTYNVRPKRSEIPFPFPSRRGTETESPFSRFMRLRREEAESSENTVNDDDDDEDDFDDVIEALDSVGEDEPDGTAEEGSNKSAPYSLSGYFEAMKFKRLISENFGDVVQRKFIDGEPCCVLNLGADRLFKLSHIDEDNIRISDFGKTISEDSKDLLKALEIIKEYNGIQYAYGEISVTVNRNGDVITALFEMFAATQRIRHLQ